jgi:erythromycin esterase-like protein
VLIGFTTHSGTVIAASAWDKPGEIKDVRPALPESYAGHFHDLGFGNALLPLRDRGDVAAGLNEPRLQRAIGVVYLPQTERQSHYFTARLSQQFDAVIHWDVTRAIEPLEQ